MNTSFINLAFTDGVKAAQAEVGTRTMFVQAERGAAKAGALIEPSVAEWLRRTDSFFIATVGTHHDGEVWPYIQHRGGEPGFVQVLDEQHFAFDDVAGNGQMITVGNLRDNDRVMLFLIDYEHAARLKLWGRARVTPTAPGLAYEQQVRRITVQLAGWNFNCSAFIPSLVKF
jgi:uncharacterized protein